MYKFENTSGQNVEVLSLEQVLEEAMQEINLLEEKNTKVQDVLNDLQNGVLNLNNSVTSFDVSQINSLCAGPNHSVSFDKERSNSFSKQLLEFKVLSRDISTKLNSTLNANENDQLLRDAFKTGLSEVKKKLSSLRIILQQLGKDQELGDTALPVSKIPSLCEPVQKDASNMTNQSVMNETVDKLQQQLDDALEKNVRWQNYNIEREQYVSLLLSKYNENSKELHQLRERFAQITSHPDKLAAEQRRHFDQLLVGARQELESARSENLHVVTELTILKEKHKDEIKRLESNVEEWRSRYESQREAIATLNANYENEKRRSNNSITESKEKQSQIQLLHRQLQLFSEDFRAERKEKEIAMNEIDFLKLKVNQLQKTVDKHIQPNDLLKDSYNKQTKTFSEACKTRKRAPLPSYISQNLPEKSVDFSHLNSQKSIMTKRPSPTPKPRLRLKDKTDAQQSKKVNFLNTNQVPEPEKTSTTPEDHVSTLSRKKASNKDSVLQCPCCGKEYDINQHLLLLDHIDICDD